MWALTPVSTQLAESSEALRVSTRPGVLCGCVCCTRTSWWAWAFALVSCSVMSCHLPHTPGWTRGGGQLRIRQAESGLYPASLPDSQHRHTIVPASSACLEKHRSIRGRCPGSHQPCVFLGEPRDPTSPAPSSSM